METVTTATGKQLETDYFASIPNPKLIYFRVLNSDIVTVAGIVGNPEELKTIDYAGNIFTNCELVSISVEFGAVKVNATYDQFYPKTVE
jgi:hypothetical protein